MLSIILFLPPCFPPQPSLSLSPPFTALLPPILKCCLKVPLSTGPGSSAM